MSKFKTEQEAFWAGSFGDEYPQRNNQPDILASSLAMFSKILARTEQVRTVIEFGANIGINMIAIKQLLPKTECSAVEINSKAAKELEKLGLTKIYNQSILDFEPDVPRDFSFTRGVLIHIAPEKLPVVYDALYRASARYICMAEYYNPVPVGIDYHGNKDKLFKRDFAGEMLDRFPDLRLIDYGFDYHRDPNFNHGDTTWFLLEKRRG